jgi:hypothetical protein
MKGCFMENVQITIPKLRIKEIDIDVNNNGKHIISIDIGLINKSGRCLSKIRLDANKSWSNANIKLTDRMNELLNEFIFEVEKEYLNDNLLELTEDYNDNAIR